MAQVAARRRSTSWRDKWREPHSTTRWKHPAALRIQARFRGILHRLRERRREREEAVESARIAARLLEEKIKAAAGVSAHAGRRNGPEQRGGGY